MTQSKIAFAMAMSMVLTACTSGAEVAENAAMPIAKLEPAPMPGAPAVGTEWHWMRNGESHKSLVVDVADGVVYGESADGCKWSILAVEFAPTVSWENCSGYTGERRIKKSKGNPWPLQLGAKWSHHYSSETSDGVPYSHAYKCRVDGAETITVPAGTFDTYKVRCKDKWRTTTKWYAPDFDGGQVVLIRHDRENGEIIRQELVKRLVPTA